jgi:hypothetical protein
MSLHQIFRGATSRYAVELPAPSGAEPPELACYLRDTAPLQFRHISVHAPAKRFDELEIIVRAQSLPSTLRAVLVNPETMAVPAHYRALVRRLVLKNMDVRKQDRRTAAKPARSFDPLRDADFCLDVAHVWSVDPSMAVAHELLDLLPVNW